MNDALKIIGFGLFWIVVPILMFTLIVFGKIIGSKMKDKEKKTSANSGWWAGHILFVFFFTYHISIVTKPQITTDITISMSITGGIFGSVLGFIILWILKPLIQTRVVGILTLIFSCTGSISLFSYFFIGNVNQFLMSVMLGLAFGTLMHLVIFPKSAYNLFTDKDTTHVDTNKEKYNLS